ncbi:glycosyltransferase [Cesiribacter andamanensis]|uniref:D-inositol-3-phosphate glycosyltransferase n=1 Tax=Cesiribacter andamanensis AMV16 TaxID=1279009 RepID=M7N2S6_9BACT|nr:glycosyltransferase [Cesiribacter andamanensis]EMR02978.1 D-inositol-3-phosphate glycosyltransferase [Cesiribacter andamanensis AMV16]
MRKKRLFFLVPFLEGGGSERVVVNLFKAIDRDCYEPTLVLFQKKGIYLEQLPPDANIHVLDVNRTRYAFVAVANHLRREKPDIVFSTLGHLNLLIALLRPLLPANIKFIARESNTISVHNKSESFPKVFDLLFKTVYRRFDTVICQCQYMKNDLIENYEFPAEKIAVINNPLDFAQVEKKLEAVPQVFSHKTFNVLFVGRLNAQKRVDLLLESMALLPADVSLYLIGKGELRQELEQQASSLGISHRVFFLGEQKNPYQYMAQAHCLALSSAYEGFPNVVLEAHACGTPVVAFDSPGGTAEIILEGINGYMAPFGDVKGFADNVAKLRETAFSKEAIRKSAYDRYNLDKIVSQYKEVFTHLTSR